MNRKTALTAAGAIVFTLAAGSSAMAVNLGILDSTSSDRVGELEVTPTSSTPATSTTVPVPSSPATTFDDHGGDFDDERDDAVNPTTAPPATGDDHGGTRDDGVSPTAAPTVTLEDHDQDDAHKDDGHKDDGHKEDEHEGREDDD
jgi:hypothetical protein